MTNIYGILAHPAGHSLSPVMHNAAFRELNLDAQYQVFDVAPDDLRRFMQRVRAENIAGLSVSIPHKQFIMKYLDEVSDTAKNIGAVNTVINQNGRFIGTNTDYLGAIKALQIMCLDLNGKKILVLGAGGAARAIVYGLREEGSEVWIANRTEKKAEILAQEFNCQVIAIEDLANLKPDIIINTTVLGMSPKWEGESPSPSEIFKANQVVMDIVYRPLKTLFLREAEKAGAKIITGEKMLLYQAVKQFELWIKASAPTEVMKVALDLAL